MPKFVQIPRIVSARQFVLEEPWPPGLEFGYVHAVGECHHFVSPAGCIVVKPGDWLIYYGDGKAEVMATETFERHFRAADIDDCLAAHEDRVDDLVKAFEGRTERVRVRTADGRERRTGFEPVYGIMWVDRSRLRAGEFEITDPEWIEICRANTPDEIKKDGTLALDAHPTESLEGLVPAVVCVNGKEEN